MSELSTDGSVPDGNRTWKEKENTTGEDTAGEDTLRGDIIGEDNIAKDVVEEPSNLVGFDGDTDPLNAQNWPFRKKVYTTGLWAFTTCWIAFATAIYSAGTNEIIAEFNTSYDAATAGTSLILWGFAIGPMLWGPLCEVFGRKWTALAPYFVSVAFTFGTATAKDIQTVLITRFFAGVFGSGPISITSGAIVDIWAPSQRGIPMVCYGITIAAAPTLGPLIGAAFIASGAGWRWTEYLTGIVMLVQFILDALFIDESDPNILVTRKAQQLRRTTKNFALHSKWEENSLSFQALLSTYLVRPFQMLLDPICLLLTVYTSFVYAILYASLESFALEYAQNRGWGAVDSALPFLAFLVGCILAAGGNIYNNTYYAKMFVTNGFKSVPEARLPPVMYGGFAFSAGLFLFGWTSSKHVSNPWPSIVGVFLTGVGFTTIFQGCLQYLVETFTRYSPSAMAANTFARSLIAGAFPLFIWPMYEKLGVDWGSTIFACIAVLLLPAPFCFFKWGKQIRARGEFSKISTY